MRPITSKQFSSLAGMLDGAADIASEPTSTIAHLEPGLRQAAKMMRENAELTERDEAAASSTSSPNAFQLLEEVARHFFEMGSGAGTYEEGQSFSVAWDRFWSIRDRAQDPTG